MSEMIERVARAIGGEVLWHFNEEIASPTQKAQRDECRRLARAAIAAMREPTKDMSTMMLIRLGVSKEGEEAERSRSDSIWRAGIDAALQDTP